MADVEFLLLLLILGGLAALVLTRGKGRGSAVAESVGDTEAEARRWYDRLGGQVMNLVGNDDASRQALSDASERYTAAGSQLSQASTTQQYKLVTETALEGLYYVRAARTAMGLDPGPELPDSQERRKGGELTQEQSVEVEGRTVTGAPQPSTQNSHYYPGGTVGGRPVPAGWYSEPWWKPMLIGGLGAVGGVMVAGALFSGFAAASAGGMGADEAMAGDPGMDGGMDDPGMDGGGMDGGGMDDFGGGGFGDFDF